MPFQELDHESMQKLFYQRLSNGCTEKKSDQLKSLNIALVDKQFIQAITPDDPLGLLKINEDGTFSFSHHSFAEYFAAMWLVEHIQEIHSENRTFLFHPDHKGIRRFFNAKLAEGCPLHLAVLDQDMSRVKQHSSECLNIDKGGRTALHLAASLGRKHTFLQTEVRNKWKQSSDKDFEKLEEIFTYLLELDSSCVLQRDELFGKNVFEYADASLCLFSLEELSKNKHFKWDFLGSFLQQPFTLSYYCVTMGYINLLNSAEKKLLEWDALHEKKSLLHLAIDSNQTQIAMSLIEHGIDLSRKDAKNQTALHSAAAWGNLQIAHLLVEKGADVVAQDDNNITPLHLAAKMGHIKVVELLLNKNAEIDATDSDKLTALHEAAKTGRTEVVKFLVTNGADKNARTANGRTALQRAAHFGHLDVVKYLVESGAEKNASDKFGKTALHYAVVGKSCEVVEFLIDQKVSMFAQDEDGKTPKQIAEESGAISIAATLATAETKNPRYVSENLGGDLHYAAETGNLKQLKNLLSHESDINRPDANQNTPLHVASFFGKLNIVEYLLQHNANPAAVNEHGRVPLHLACQKGNVKIVEKLLNRGQNAVVDNWGLTPLHRAAYNGHKKVVELLEKLGVDLNPISKSGGTPLHSAARGGNVDLLDWFLSKSGIDIMSKNYKQKTCLHIAVESNQLETVKYLINKSRVIRDEKDSQGRTALHIAAESKYKEIVKVLSEGGADDSITNQRGQTAVELLMQ